MIAADSALHGQSYERSARVFHAAFMACKSANDELQVSMAANDSAFAAERMAGAENRAAVDILQRTLDGERKKARRGRTWRWIERVALVVGTYYIAKP